MKNYHLFLLLLLFSACSKFSDDLNLISHPTPTLDIDTHLPVINLILNKEEFEEMTSQPDDEIEIEGSFYLYRNQALLIQNQKIEIEVKGGFSTKFPLKSLGIKFDDKYDNTDRSLINPQQVLPNHNLDKIKAIRLRNSGSDFTNTMLKDLSVTQLAINAGLNVDLTYGEPALVYINGDFYGLLNLRTEANTNGMAGLYDVKKKDVTLAKITTPAFIKKDGDFERLDRLVQAIANEELDFVKEELDLNSFIDYMIFESYIGNTDWPHNNARIHAIKDGKFRFVLFDLDKVSWLKMDKSPLQIITNKRLIKVNKDEATVDIITDLFFLLYEDTAFKDSFWERYQFLLDQQTLAYDKFKTIVDYNADQINPLMPLQIEKYQAPGSMIEWQIELDKLLSLFREREEVVREYIENR